MSLDINAPHAQLVRLLIQTILTNVLLNHSVINSHTDFQEMLPHAEDARDATGHLKFQTQFLEPDVLPDQDHNALVLKDMVMVDTHALTAHSDKLEEEDTLILEPPLILSIITLLTNVLPQQLVLELTKFNLLLMLNHAVDAKLANSQDSSQMSLELNALLDHLLSAHHA
jgi:hypothetical protein